MTKRKTPVRFSLKDSIGILEKHNVRVKDKGVTIRKGRFDVIFPEMTRFKIDNGWDLVHFVQSKYPDDCQALYDVKKKVTRVSELMQMLGVE